MLATLIVAVLALTGTGLAVAQPAPAYEAPGTYRPAEVLPKELVRGPRWEVVNPVVSDGYMYRFKVKSDYGMFDAAGVGALRKLVGEIAAIAKLKEIRASKAFASAVADSATGPFRFAKNLIVHPVDTFTGVPKGMYKLTEDVAEAVVTDSNPSDDPVYKKALLVSGRKREYAAQLGVDVYSSNKVLQEELNSVGWAAAVGNLTVSAALMPVGGAAGAALSGVRWSNAINDYTKAEPAPRLKIIAEEKLTQSGIPAELARRFVNQPRFTPRHYILIAESLARLGPAPSRGREAFLETALGAADETEADYYSAVAQMLRGYHETVSPIVEVRMSRRLAVARAQNGNTVVPMPIDFLVWTETVDHRSGDLLTAHRESGATGQPQLWLTGTASRPAMQQLVDRKVAVIEDARRRVEILD